MQVTNCQQLASQSGRQAVLDDTSCRVQCLSELGGNNNNNNNGNGNGNDQLPPKNLLPPTSSGSTIITSGGDGNQFQQSFQSGQQSFESFQSGEQSFDSFQPGPPSFGPGPSFRPAPFRPPFGVGPPPGPFRPIQSAIGFGLRGLGRLFGL